MDIVVVAPRSWPAVGGMETFLRHLTHALAPRHRIRVLAQGLDSGPRGRLADSLSPPPAFDAFDDGPVRVEPIRLSPARRAVLAPLASQVVPGLRRYAYGRARHASTALFARTAGPVIARAAHGTDLVHMWGGDMLGAAAVRAARHLGVPVLMTPFAHERRWGDDEAAAATYREADGVVALLETEAATYVEHGVSRDNVHVIGVCSAGVPGGDGERLRRERGISGPLVVFIGVRRPYKGYDLLLEAASHVHGATFAFIGPGDPVPPRPHVRMVDAGEVDDDAKAAWLDAADVLCLPSESEIFPASFLEAWSVGTPVIASDIPTLAELVARSGGGWTAPRDAKALAARLTDALADPSALRARGEAGRAFWRRHTPEAVAARYEELYERLRRKEQPCAA